MNEKEFFNSSNRSSEIIRRFGITFGLCFSWGLIAGLLYHFLSLPKLQKEIITILKEQSATHSFNFLSMIAIFTIGLMISGFGRTERITNWRYILCYKPGEIALNFAAVVYGLYFGFVFFGVDSNSLKLILLMVIAFFYGPVGLLLLIWASFQGNLTKNEYKARLFAGILTISSVVYFFWHFD